MANYGDVALNLPADWDRSTLHQKDFSIQTVGHREGVADAYLTKDKDARHQFYWADPRDQRGMARLNLEGFRPVIKEEWTINEGLWAWNAGNQASFGVEILMARPAALYFAALEAKESIRDRESRKMKAEEEMAIRRANVSVTDEGGKRISRTAR